MSPIIVFGVLFWVLNSRKRQMLERPSRTPGARGTPAWNQRPTESVARPMSYIDDGMLSPEEATAIMHLLNHYRSADSLRQQDIQRNMDARIKAQFNHLLNSSWSMDGPRVMDYLAQQGRHGRYTALGAFALRVMR